MGEKSTDWLGFLAALAWPLTALLALWLFYEPVKKSLDRVSRGEAQAVAVGPISVRFSPDALRSLPVPSPQITRHIQQLANLPYEREMLLSLGYRNSHADSCTRQGFEQAVRAGTRESNDFFATRLQALEDYRRYIGAHDTLARLGLVRFVPPSPHEINTTLFCAGGAQRKAQTTEIGDETRDYYLRLVDQALSIRTPEPEQGEQ